MVLGDCNIHNPISDPKKDFTSNELSLSNPYFLTVLDTSYSLLNTPGWYTRISNAKVQRSSVIDLCFINPHVLPFSHSWKNNLPSSGSDNTVIRVTITPLSPNPAQTGTSSLGFNLKLPDRISIAWALFAETAQECVAQAYGFDTLNSDELLSRVRRVIQAGTHHFHFSDEKKKVSSNAYHMVALTCKLLIQF
jgi:hypothetical protein